MFVCACAWVRWGGRPEDVRSCVHAWVGGCWKTEAQLCSLIFWERSGGVVDPPAPFSSAGSRRISAAASLHKVTLCNLPQAHKYNCNQERRGEREEEGQWTVKAPGEKGHWLFSACTSVAGRWHMTTYSRAPISFCTVCMQSCILLIIYAHILRAQAFSLSWKEQMCVHMGNDKQTSVFVSFGPKVSKKKFCSSFRLTSYQQGAV